MSKTLKPPEFKNLVNFRGPRRRLLLVFFLLCCVVALFFSLAPPKKLPTCIVLTEPIVMPQSMRHRFERLIPRKTSWSWAWRAEEWMLGKRKPVTIDLSVVSLEGDPGSVPAEAPAFRDANGLCVWLPDQDRLKAMRKLWQSLRVTTEQRARITTGEGMDCQLSSGESVTNNGMVKNVGLEMKVFAKIHPGAIDLIVGMKSTSVVTNTANSINEGASRQTVLIQTNLNVALRLQIPKGHGIFVLDKNAPNLNGKRVGVIIDPLQPKN